MATRKAFDQAMSLFFMSFPSRKPQGKPEEIEAILDVWEKALADIKDQTLLNAVARFIRETKKLFPDDNPLAMIREMAEIESKPKSVPIPATFELTEEQRQAGLNRIRDFKEKIKSLSRKTALPDDSFEARQKEQIERLKANG